MGNIQGSVHGGQAPVTGAQIYLFAASTAGYGSASTSLIKSGKTGVTCNTSGTLNGDCYVTTDSNGNFALGGDYTCTQGTQVYMVAVGGNPGLSGGKSPISTTATFARRSTTITVTSAAGITTGMAITATGIAAGTTVTAVNGTSITISQQTTARENNGVTVTFSTTTATFSSGSSTITVASASGITAGLVAIGSGVGGTVTGVSGTTVTLSQKNTSTGSAVPVMFSAPGSVNNTAIVQMAALAQCPAAGNLAAQVPYLVINEVTTVAFAYSMSGFASDPFHIAADATGATALANAMANAGNIVNVQYGQAPSVANGNPNSIVPVAKLYTLANIVAECVNSSDAGTSNCTSLFNLAKNSAGTAPTDESTALFNIAQNQATNVTAIYNLMIDTVFTPTLNRAPTDWTMPVIYKGLVSVPGTTNNQITSGPFNMAFDANGTAWIGDRVNGVVEVGPQGAATAINKGFGMVKGVAVSPIDGTIWVSDYGKNVLDVMDTTGTILTPITTDMNGPIFTAFSGNTAGHSSVFEVNETTTGVVLFDPTAHTVQDFEGASNFSHIQTPGWISVDNNGNAWIPSTSTNYVGQVTAQETGNSGKFTYGSTQINGPLAAYSMAADGNGNLWFGSNAGDGDLEEIRSGRTTATDIGNGGGVNGAYKMAVDGNNTIWIANANANTVSAYNGGWVAANGFSTSAPGGTGCVIAAPDPSGNLWTANADGSLTQLLGLATPTAAPFYGGTSSTGRGTTGNLGTMP